MGEQVMGCVQQAVLEFDGEVQAPWRPRLVSEPVIAAGSAVPALQRRPGGRSTSRVGVCRPSAPAAGRPLAAGAVRPGRAARHADGRPRSTGVRLTRRARRLAVVLALCGGVVLGSLANSLVSGAGGEGLHLAGVSSVTVEPGDTLWSIAESVAAGDDVRAVVDRIQELNGLDGSGLVPGQVLQLP
jgi:nucleoid-associated protein YgaU